MSGLTDTLPTMTMTSRRTLTLDFPELNDLTGGIRPGQLAVVGARPGVGKTNFLFQILRTAAVKDRMKVFLINAETSQEDVAVRLKSGESGVKICNILHGSLTLDQRASVSSAESDIANSNLTVVNSTPLTLEKIEETLLKEADRRNMDTVGIDCLDIINNYSNKENLFTLKRLALRLNIPIICTMRLRDGFKIEHLEDVDLAIRIVRPDADYRDHERAGEADFHVEKSRLGPRAVVTLGHQLHLARFHALMGPEPSSQHFERTPERLLRLRR